MRTLPKPLHSNDIHSAIFSGLNDDDNELNLSQNHKKNNEQKEKIKSIFYADVNKHEDTVNTTKQEIQMTALGTEGELVDQYTESISQS